MKYPTLLLFLIIYNIVAVSPDDALEEFLKGNHKFTSRMYQQMVQRGKQNFILSPFSIEVILALINEGATGKTSEELVAGLSLPGTRKKTQEALKSILSNLKENDAGLKISSANKIYAADHLELKKTFKSVANDVYKSDIEKVDFHHSEGTSSKINQWVSKATHKKIQNIISGEIDPSTKLILINAVYFNGKWSYPFNKRYTFKSKFSINAKDSVEVEMMHQKHRFGYYEYRELDAKILRLPYEGDDVSMIIALPNKISGLDRLKKNIEKLLAPYPLDSEMLEIEIPKFKIETEIDLVAVLQKLGVSHLFKDDAELDGISTSDKKLKVDEILQKTYINVSESGTEAAAATYAKVTALKSHSLQTFYVNRPFIYFIKLKEVVLFAGLCSNPAGSTKN